MNTIDISGVYGSAKVYVTENRSTAIDRYATAQLQMLCDNEASKGSVIRVMPDVHPGKVCTIGLTMRVTDRILPEIVGIDIGCGVSIAKIDGFRNDFRKLDTVIRENVPSGFCIRGKTRNAAELFDFDRLCCAEAVNRKKAVLSIGTLGGGNHFIEIGRDSESNSGSDCYYLVVHSGSRHLGKEITEHYLREGQKELQRQGFDVPYELTYLTGSLMEQYIHDAALAAEYASVNRSEIIRAICRGMKWKPRELSESVHNYIGHLPDGRAIIRKGAISALEGERVIIPVNMRDGILIGTGRGNPEWNHSAPHGAGRILKREDVKNHFTLSAYKKEMEGIYSSTVTAQTLDEAPFAYRSLEEIREAVNDTVTVDKLLRPVYNFKAAGERR